MANEPAFRIAAGARVHLHQAFACCPYAGAVSSRVHDFLEKNGHEVVDDASAADVHVITTCGSDAGKAQLTFDVLDRLGDAARTQPVLALGCLVNIEPKRLREATSALPRRALLDPRHLAELDAIFDARTTTFDAVPHTLKSRYSGNPLATGWYHVTVGTGCFGKCSFCAIRRATGRPVSRPIADILGDVDRGVDAGVPDVLLIGTDVSAWGADLGLSVVDLMRAVVDYPREALFAVEAFEPTLFLEHLDALLPLVERKRFSILAVPIQSGSQRVLDAMRRTYDIDRVMRAIERVRAVDPDVLFRTDIIYGFGDETREEFEASLALCPHFDQVGFNLYQPRSGTPPIVLPPDELAERTARVMEVHRARTIAPARQPRRIKPAPPKDANDIPWTPIEEDALVPSARSTDLVPLRVGRNGEPAAVTSAAAAAPAPAAPPPAASPTPRDEAHEQWLDGLAARLARIVERHGGLDLGEGFRARAPRRVHELDAVVLDVNGTRGERFALALQRPDAEGDRFIARSSRFAVFVAGDIVGGEPARRALQTLLRALGLAEAEAAPPSV